MRVSRKGQVRGGGHGGGAHQAIPARLTPIPDDVAALIEAHADDRDFVASLARGLAVIQAFTNQGRQMSISQVSYKTGLTRAAVRRYLHTLAMLGYAHCDDAAGYSLTAKTVSLGNAYLSGTPASGRAQPILDVLSETVGEACSMAVRDGIDIVYVSRASSSRIMSPSLNVGSRLPAYATSIGLVLLAHLSESELDDYLGKVNFLPFTANTIVNARELGTTLEQIRADGYAISDQQIEVGLRSVAVPVLDAAGRVVSGINIIAHSSRVTVAQMRSRFLPLLREAAQALRM